MGSPSDLRGLLRRYWGYEDFRPLQERIVASILDGKDVAVVMPTGGGKSLCYQLPALVSQRTAVVISPLIALMQDQVAQLRDMGIAAGSLNSTATEGEQSRTKAQAMKGELRLLYLSPERLARADTIAWLRRVPVSFFAIDEAHCISEWGHEFRPEYRQLSSLRDNFPERSIAAFTASATRQVRHDILNQLRLRDPDKYIVSFHRPNLRYLVRQCENEAAQWGRLIRALRAHGCENVIVYAPTIARVESTVDRLADAGLAAIPYHGQMDPRTRQRNQERWMSDEVRILVGTVAFGLGINKPGVRAVIHLSLPKSIEQYYQEAGRAGRDGESADCALLWLKRDAGLLAHFIEAIGDRAEEQRAWQRYHEIRGFAESALCRHRQICLHFGETPKWERCDACDVCSEPPEWLSKTTAPAKKRETKPISAAHVPARQAAPSAALNAELLDFLREWRRKLAAEENVPAFLILHDSSLEDLCRRDPRDKPGLLAVSGMGEKKFERYGPAILEALARFRAGARAEARIEPQSRPAEETIRLLAEGHSFEEIARIRDRRLNTVIDMVADLIEKGQTSFDPRWIPEERRLLIEAAIERLGPKPMKPVKEALPDEITYGEIRIVAAALASRRA